MASEMYRIMCCIAMWVLVGFIWLMPEPSQVTANVPHNTSFRLANQITQAQYPGQILSSFRLKQH